MKIRIVIPCHNSRESLRKLLQSLERIEDISLEQVLVIDDGSNDGTHEMLQNEFPLIQTILGNGTLYWTGAIRIGMQRAMDEGVDFIFWLNHDCRPEQGAFTKLIEVLRDLSVGCVSGYCRIAGFPEYPVNPGFKNFEPIEITTFPDGLMAVDGVNGNFVGFRADWVRHVGLPDAKRHPHYGDGPYSYRLKKAGSKVLVHLLARADLDYEVLRRLPPFWRVVLSEESFAWWLRYFFTSFKSQYHLIYRWNDAVAFRGWLALLSYPKTELQTFFAVTAGALSRRLFSREHVLEKVKQLFAHRYPMSKLMTEIAGE